MPKEVPKSVLENNRNIILQTLESFGGKRYAPAAATRAIAENLVSTKAKPVLKQLVQLNEELYRDKNESNPFLSEAIGSYGKYQWALAATASHLASVDGTPLSKLTQATFFIIDYYVPNYYRTEGTRSTPENLVPRKDAVPTSGFKKLVRKILKQLAEHDHVDFDESREMVYKNTIDPVRLFVDFWGDVLHKTQSSFKRNVCTIKASLDAPLFSETFGLISDFHFGREYGFKPEDVQRWWRLIGPKGAGFAYIDPIERVHLQYEKGRFSDVKLVEKEAEPFGRLNSTIKLMPFVSKNQLKKLYPGDYAIAVKVWNENPTLSPTEIADSYVSKELAFQLGWHSREPLGLEQHNARPVLQNIWEYMDPKLIKSRGGFGLDQIKEASDIVITALSDLKSGRRFIPTTPYESMVMKALSDYVEETPEGFEVKKGMEDAVQWLSLYVGIL